MLPLRQVWDAVEGGPAKDVEKFRDELLWQEYARHLYARVGTETRHSLRYSVPEHSSAPVDPWPAGAQCIERPLAELADQGWLTNQTRMWLASQWSVRHNGGWREGEDFFFRSLLDGSRAANRLGWQWTVGALTGKPYGFSRWQVMKRAPQFCAQCDLQHACPIEDWPPADEPEARALPIAQLRRDEDVDSTAGPSAPMMNGDPEAVWLTAESLGDRDPALQAYPNLPVVFVFDAPLLRTLRLAGHRLVFLAQTLADLAQRRDLRIHLGDPTEVLAGTSLAGTFTPVPGWRTRASRLHLVVQQPWPWLIRPHAGSVASFTAWRRSTADRLSR
jgi:deoxyribodipyrimidine photo-lyase